MVPAAGNVRAAGPTRMGMPALPPRMEPVRARVPPLPRPGRDRRLPVNTPPLEDHLAWLRSIGAKECTCRYEYKGLGRLYGTSLGKGWLRMDTRKDCPEHGDVHADVARR